MKVLIDYCSLIRKGDLKLETAQSIETQDLIELYEDFKILNKLSKCSNPQYFDQPNSERLIRYLETYTLFQENGYNVSNLCENIADCYANIKEYLSAIKYIEKAIDINIKEINEDMNKKKSQKTKAAR